MERTNSDSTGGRQTGPWVLALGVLAVGTVALVRELRRNRGETVSEDS
ncbi:hypothetical protein [Haladaptatus sp. DFWS20]